MNIFSHYKKLICFAFQGDAGFYAARNYLAEVLIDEMEEFVNLKNKKVLDVGGERGEFCQILAQKRHCQAINLEPKPISGKDFVWKTKIGRAENLPFKDQTFDIVLFRGVIQHIPESGKLKSLEEIHRVLKKDGFAYVMIPPWYYPLSGQTIKPFQYFPFKIARHLRNSIFLSKITANSLSELGLYPMTFKKTVKLIKQADFKVIKTYDILGRIHFLTKIPLLREFFLPSVGFILQNDEN